MWMPVSKISLLTKVGVMITLTIFVVFAVVSQCLCYEAQPCNPNDCRLPDCRCAGIDIPGNVPLHETPQFVTITFDDAVTFLNNEYYQQAFPNRVNPDGCPVAATYYISHEYTDYSLVSDMVEFKLRSVMSQYRTHTRYTGSQTLPSRTRNRFTFHHSFLVDGILEETFCWRTDRRIFRPKSFNVSFCQNSTRRFARNSNAIFADERWQKLRNVKQRTHLVWFVVAEPKGARTMALYTGHIVDAGLRYWSMPDT